mgnify:CR=1 FL=1
MLKDSFYFLLAGLFIFLLQGCAFLHHVHISDVDSTALKNGQAFEILVSETGFNLAEATSVAKAFTQSQQTREGIGKFGEYLHYFQMGPRTGNMVFSEKYADVVNLALYEKCPSGKMTGLTIIREQRKYQVVSGEIVKVTGYCLN